MPSYMSSRQQRSSHILPPTSFNQTTKGFRDSLRKIPSSLFSSKENVAKVTSKSSGESYLPATTVSSIAQDRRLNPIDLAKNEVKPQSNPRWALGAIFGRKSNVPQFSVTSSPSIAPPPIPPKDSMTIKRLTLKSLNSSQSSRTSQPRKSYVAPKLRPSVPADPFGRDVDGAEVIESILRSSATVKRVPAQEVLLTGDQLRGQLGVTTKAAPKTSPVETM